MTMVTWCDVIGLNMVEETRMITLKDINILCLPCSNGMVNS